MATSPSPQKTLRRVSFLVGIAALLACGEALGLGGHQIVGPCKHGDRRCKTSSAPKYAFQLFWGGAKSNDIATGAPIATVTSTRSSPTLCLGADGGLQQLGPNAPCVEPHGLAARAPVQNLVTHSSDMTVDFNTFNVSVIPGAACPDGTTGVTVYDNQTNDRHEFYEGIGGTNPGAGFYTMSVNAKPTAVNPATVITMVVGGDGHEASFDLTLGFSPVVADIFQGSSLQDTAMSATPITNGFWHLSWTTADDFGDGNAAFFLGKSLTEAIGAYSGTDSGVILCDPQVTFTQDDRPYVANDGGPGLVGQRNADLHVAANPLDGGASSWVLAVNAEVDNLRYDTWRQRGLLQLGGDAGDADTATFYITDAGFPVCSVVDHLGGVKTATATTVVWPGRRYLSCVNATGTLSVAQDDKTLTVVASGSGTGKITNQPGALVIGSQGGVNEFGGDLEVCVDPAASGCPYSGASKKPWSARPKTLVALGDSLTNNPTLNPPTNFWPNMIAQDRPSWTVVNAGQAATKIAQQTIVYLDGGWFKNPPHYVAWQGGINDFGIYSSADLQMFWTKQFFDQVAASGSTPVAIRESPCFGSSACGDNSSYDTSQVLFDALARRFGYPYIDNYVSFRDGGALEHPTLACDLDYDTAGGNACVSTPNYIHWNDAGQGKMAQEFEATVAP